MRRIRPRIHSTLWGRTHEGPGDLEHHYHVPDAPWLGHGAFAHPIPDHIHALLAEIRTRHEPIHVTDGTAELRAEPLVTGIRIQEVPGSDPPAYRLQVNVAWYAGDPRTTAGLHGESYEEILAPEHHEPHHRHKLAMERRIHVTLAGHHGLRRE